ncbi:hypothetical protein [Pseudomonas fluorescens]|uniref:hypothetical protein n=1 Tax=Pseudomonas fluorescens TaxID=294 RepID=UPI0009BA5F1F|nr:hypothetical protein [Pseudomonas fluorescens]
MKKYLSIINLLQSIFSVDVGLERNSEIAILDRILKDDFQRREIESELVGLFSDSSVSWVELLDNESYLVYPADDEYDAKTYMVEILWDRVFPDSPVP